MKKQKGKKKAFLAVLLSAAVICQTFPAYSLAAQGPDGICPHHTAHTEACGYREAVTGAPCNHQHTEECYKTETKCLHQHTEDCYPLIPSEETQQVRGSEPTACTHVCSEESGCITKTEACTHVQVNEDGTTTLLHDEKCGYVAAQEAAACQFVCEECIKEAAESEKAAQAAAEAQQKIDHVQSLISALPEADSITADNLESVKGDLAAIEAAKAELDTTQQAALNLEKYNAAVERVAVVEGELEAERIESEQAAQEAQQKIDNVQSLISALPEAESITAENLESVKGDLAAIEAAKAELDETQQAALNMEKYNAAVERIAAIEAKPQKAPTDTQEAGNDVATVTIDGVETPYPTLAAAIEAADGKTATITVLQSTTEAADIHGGNITLELKNNCFVNKSIIVYGGVIKVIGEGKLTQLSNGSSINESSGEIIIEGEVTITTLMPWNGKTTVAEGEIVSLSHWGGTTIITGGVISALKGSGNIIVKGGTIKIIDEGTTLNYVPDSVTLDQPELSLKVNEQKTLTATVTPNISAPGFPVWESSDTGVATVSNGTVTAVATGEATITVKAGEQTATCKVTVYKPKAEKPQNLKINYAGEYLENTTSDMEFSTDEGKSWRSCTEPATSLYYINLENGVYEKSWKVRVRTKGNASMLPSDWVEIEIPAVPNLVISVDEMNTTANKLTVNVEGVPEGAKVKYYLVNREIDEERGWQESNEFPELKSGIQYSVVVEVEATKNTFRHAVQKYMSTLNAKYTISIPTSLEAGGAEAAVSVDTSQPFDLGYEGKVNVAIAENSNGYDGNVTMKRAGAENTLESELKIDGTKVTGGKIASFADKTGSVKIQASEPKITGGSIVPAGQYTGNVTFQINYQQ